MNEQQQDVVEPDAMDDIVGDPTPENPAEAGDLAPVELQRVAADPDPAPAVVEESGPGAPAVSVADELPEPEPDAVPEQRTDGRWQLGKYVADDLAQLVVQVNKGRVNAEKLVGAKTEQLLDPNVNPFLVTDDETNLDDEFDEEPFDEGELGDAFGAGIAKALLDAGITGAGQQQHAPQVDQQQQVMQVLNTAQQVIDSPNARDEDFRSVLQALVMASPEDVKSRQTVLAEWASRGPEQAVAAAQEAADIQVAFAQFQQQQQQAIQYQQAVADAEAEQQQQHAVEQASLAERAAYEDAVNAFVERAPDWQQHDPAMKQWMAQNQPLLAAARGNAAAIYAVFNSAYQYAQAVGGAGVVPGVSEQVGSMNTVTTTPVIDAGTASREHVQGQRALAGLETGAAVDDVSVVVADPNPPGLAETPLGDLLGVDLVS